MTAIRLGGSKSCALALAIINSTGFALRLRCSAISFDLNAQSESESNRDVAFLRRDVDNSCHFENKQLNLTTTMVYQEPKEEEMRSLTGKHGAKDCHGCVCNLVVTFSAHAELAEALPELHTLVRS